VLHYLAAICYLEQVGYLARYIEPDYLDLQADERDVMAKHTSERGILDKNKTLRSFTDL